VVQVVPVVLAEMLVPAEVFLAEQPLLAVLVVLVEQTGQLLWVDLLDLTRQ